MLALQVPKVGPPDAIHVKSVHSEIINYYIIIIVISRINARGLLYKKININYFIIRAAAPGVPRHSWRTAILFEGVPSERVRGGLWWMQVKRRTIATPSSANCNRVHGSLTVRATHMRPDHAFRLFEILLGANFPDLVAAERMLGIFFRP